MTGERRDFGNVRKRASGRWQARWKLNGIWYSARRTDDDNHDLGPLTFASKGKALAHLGWISREIEAGRWRPPVKGSTATKVPTFSSYAESWLTTRKLKPRTKAHYRALLDNHLIPAFGDVEVSGITPASVRQWHATIADRPTLQSHAYGLLRTILGDAVSDGLLPSNPCRIRGASAGSPKRDLDVLSLAELGELVAAMPDRYRLMTLLAAWTGLRFGELTELRRKDIDIKGDEHALIRVRRGVTWHRSTGFVVGTTKGNAERAVTIPPHLFPAVTERLRDLPIDPDALLFPARHGGHLQASTLFKVFRVARAQIGRPELRWHDLRHVGAVLAAATGATLAEMMARFGWSTPQVAMRYQHAAADRDRVIADALSKLAEGEVVDIRRKESAK